MASDAGGTNSPSQDHLVANFVSGRSSTIIVETIEEQPQDFAIVDHALHFDNVQDRVPRDEDGTTTPSSKLSLSAAELTDSILEDLSTLSRPSRRVTIDQEELHDISQSCQRDNDSDGTHGQETSIKYNQMFDSDVDPTRFESVAKNFDRIVVDAKPVASEYFSGSGNENVDSGAYGTLPAQHCCPSRSIDGEAHKNFNALLDHEDRPVKLLQPSKILFVIMAIALMYLSTGNYLSENKMRHWCHRVSEPMVVNALNTTSTVEEECPTPVLSNDIREYVSSSLADEGIESAVATVETFNSEPKVEITNPSWSNYYDNSGLEDHGPAIKGYLFETIAWLWHTVTVTVVVLSFLSAVCFSTICARSALQWNEALYVEAAQKEFITSQGKILYQLVQRFHHEPRLGRTSRCSPAETFGLSSVEVENFQSLDSTQLRAICQHFNVGVKGHPNKNTLVYAAGDAYRKALIHSSKREIMAILSLKGVSCVPKDLKNDLVWKALKAGL